MRHKLASEVLKIPPSDVDSPGSVFAEGESSYVTGVGKLQGRLIILLDIAKLGGIHPDLRARRLKEIALIALNEFDGDLGSVLQLPQPQATRALKKFPSIADPGAEKILLFTRTYPVLALESNGLRVLLRLGFGQEHKNYSTSYASVREALRDQIGDDFDFLIGAHQLLRQHGKELCKTNAPDCQSCPLARSCGYYAAH